MMEHESVMKMWEDYLESIGEDARDTDKTYISWHFCDNEKDANELAELVKENVKRATTSLHYSYEVDGDPLPKVGELGIITDWNGIAQCVIRTKKVRVLAFGEVDEELAAIEGEGDKSLKYWRDAHKDVYVIRMKEYGREFTEDTMVVFEEFEVVYK